MHGWLWLLVALTLNAAANVMMKVGSRTALPLAEPAGALDRLGHMLNPATLAGLGLFAANVLFYRKALDSLNVSVAYPVMVSAGLVLITLAATTLPVLRERLTPWQVVGMVLIGVGVWLVAAHGQPARP